MTNYMRGARPKGSPKPTKGLYKKRGANKNKTTNVRGGTTGKGTVFKIVKAVVVPLSYFLRVTLIDVPPVLHNVPAITKDFELAVTISVKLLLDIATVASSKLFAIF